MANRKIKLGSKIKLENGQGTIDLKIVDEKEAKPSSGLVAHNSPMGRAVIGKRQGQTVTVRSQFGSIKYIVKKIYS